MGAGNLNDNLRAHPTSIRPDSPLTTTLLENRGKGGLFRCVPRAPSDMERFWRVTCFILLLHGLLSTRAVRARLTPELLRWQAAGLSRLPTRRCAF